MIIVKAAVVAVSLSIQNQIPNLLIFSFNVWNIKTQTDKDTL